MGKHRSTDRPRIQTLLTQLTTLKMNSGEPISDYLTRAEMLKLDLEEAGEQTSDTMFSAMVLKGLPAAYESIVTVLNFGVQKHFNDMKQDLINFANTRCSAGSDVASTAFHSSGKKREACFKCKAEGHWAKDCKAKETRTCHKCKKKGHIAKDCRSGKTQGAGTGNAASTGEKQGSGFFSFGSFEQPSDVDSLDLLVDSGCNGFMLKDRALFKDLDESFRDEVGNANGSRTAVEGRGTARCWVLDSKGQAV